MTTTVPKFELKLNEASELNFKLTIEGTTSEGNLAAPEFRFVVTETKNALTEGNGHLLPSAGMGWLFPAHREENDIVSVKIAPNKESFETGKKYHGKLEVIIGNLLMVPAEVILEFVRPLQIEATPIISKKEGPSIRALESVAVVSSVVGKQQKNVLPAAASVRQRPPSLEEEISSVISSSDEIVEEKIVAANKPAIKPVPTQAENMLREEQRKAALKKYLKGLIRSTLNESLDEKK